MKILNSSFSVSSIIKIFFSFNLSNFLRFILQFLASISIYDLLAAEEATYVFQALFLQSIIITVISGNAYFDGFYGKKTWFVFKEKMFYISISWILFFLIFIVGCSLWHIRLQVPVVLPLIIGALFIPISSFLTGYSNSQIGYKKSSSLMLLSASGSLLLFFLLRNLGVFYILLSLQFTSILFTLILFLYITFWRPSFVDNAISGPAGSFKFCRLSRSSLFNHLLMGLSGFISLISFFGFRYYWSENMAPELSSKVFLILRISMQMLSVLPIFLPRFDMNKIMLSLSSNWTKLVFVVVLIPLFILMYFYYNNFGQSHVSLFFLAFIQAAVDILSIIGILSSVWLQSEKKIRELQFIRTLANPISFSVLFLFGLVSSPFSIYIFLATSSCITYLYTYRVHLISLRSTSS